MLSKLIKPKKDMVVITLKSAIGDPTYRKVYITAFGKTIQDGIQLNNTELYGVKKVINKINENVGVDMIRLYD